MCSGRSNREPSPQAWRDSRPDGRYIVYDRTPGRVAALDLFVLDVSGGGETPLVQHPADDCVFGSGIRAAHGSCFSVTERERRISGPSAWRTAGPPGNAGQSQTFRWACRTLGVREGWLVLLRRCKGSTGRVRRQNRPPDKECPHARCEGDRSIRRIEHESPVLAGRQVVGLRLKARQHGLPERSCKRPLHSLARERQRARLHG